MRYRRLLLRIAYGYVYILFCVLLIGLLLVTLSDTIHRSLRNGQNYNVWIIAVCLVTTVAVVGIVYVLRLYINKTALASIPRPWVPVERGDVKGTVYKMIAAGMSRSAAIAYLSRPRDRPQDWDQQDSNRPAQSMAKPPSGFDRKAMRMASDVLGIVLPPPHTIWGEIEHNGWASPDSIDMPNLQYHTVLSELPNLIEGKALKMAPTDQTEPSGPSTVNADAVDILQRRPSMSLRSYVDHLIDLSVVPANKTTADFVSNYERGRFSNQSMSNARFHELMHLFAKVLRAMRPLDPKALDGDDRSLPPESDIDNDAPMYTNPSSRRTSLSWTGIASSCASRRRSERLCVVSRPTSNASLGRSMPNSEFGSVVRLGSSHSEGSGQFAVRLVPKCHGKQLLAMFCEAASQTRLCSMRNDTPEHSSVH